MTHWVPMLVVLHVLRAGAAANGLELFASVIGWTSASDFTVASSNVRLRIAIVFMIHVWCNCIVTISCQFCTFPFAVWLPVLSSLVGLRLLWLPLGSLVFLFSLSARSLAYAFGAVQISYLILFSDRFGNTPMMHV